MLAVSGKTARRNGIPHKGGVDIEATQDNLIDTAKKLADCTQAISNQQMYVSQIAVQLSQARAILEQMHNSLQGLLRQYHDLLVMTDTSQQPVMQMQPIQQPASVANLETIKQPAISSTKG